MSPSALWGASESLALSAAGAQQPVIGKKKKMKTIITLLLLLPSLIVAQSPWNGTSGFAQVSSNEENPPLRGQMFYWFFPPRNGDMNAPMMIWLQGGPGSSGIAEGLLKLNGPYSVALTIDGLGARLMPRGTTWNEDYAMLYVDSPVGTGYSYQTSGNYATSQAVISEMLIQTLEHVYAEGLWPSSNGLYVAGESYGGHYCPSLGASILRKKLSPGGTPVDLKGVAIGDGFTDPATQVVTKPKAAYYMGLVDEKTRDQAQIYADQAASYANIGNYEQAASFRNSMENLILSTSQINGYDIRTFEQYDDSTIEDFLNNATTKQLLNVPANVTFGTSPQVSANLQGDIMRSYKAEVETLLGMGIPVLLYQGQMDWKDGATSNDAWINTMYPDTVFSEREVLGVTTTRDIRDPFGILPIHSITTVAPYGWIRQLQTDIVAGYTGITLYDVVIAAAGHLVPYDQPIAAKDMITRFISGNLTLAGNNRVRRYGPVDEEKQNRLRGNVAN